MFTKCVKCNSENIYFDGNLWNCPECFHEWSETAADQNLNAANAELSNEDSGQIKDANGNILTDGDSVVVIKELKIKGSSQAVKSGTKVKGIRLVDSSDGHNISCKIDGIGSINLKSEFVRKS